jgi:hypothetical protein
MTNTDREIYREPDATGNGDFYSDSIHVTASGAIGIDCGGHVIVKPLRAWFALASLSGSQGQWQPIESAPKNRSLVYVPHYGIAIALPCSDGTWWSDEVPDQTCLPTLWWPMPPLPPPPADPTTGR